MKIYSQKGMTLIETMVGGTVLAILVIVVMYSINTISKRYIRIKDRRAIFPLADELKVSVALDLKRYFTEARRNAFCSGDGTPLPLYHTDRLPSGIKLNLYDKYTANTLPTPQNFPEYSEAVNQCRGAVFNPPPFNYDQNEVFEFCATIDCPKYQSKNEFSHICKYTGTSDLPFLVKFSYVIRRTENGSAYRCADTKQGWPGDALGELSYRFFWGSSKEGDHNHYTDSGIFHGNRTK